VVLLLVAVPRTAPAAQPRKPVPTIDLFFKAASLNEATSEAALAEIAAGWKEGYAGMMIDQALLMQRSALGNPFSLIRFARLLEFLEAQTGQSFGNNLNRWREWIWSRPYDPHPDYGAFKGALYTPIDPRFEDFFREPFKSSIRLDQVEWGGVAVNGIPPLDHPKHIRPARPHICRTATSCSACTPAARRARIPNASSRGTSWRATGSATST
jgi:hypothetical protein